MSSPSVIFVVGNSRSGTTMLGRVLGNHSRIHTFSELHFFENELDAQAVVQRPEWSVQRRLALLERLLTSAREGFFSPVVAGRFRQDAERILATARGNDAVSAYEALLRTETVRFGKQIPCEQTPRYLFFTGEILAAFPGARIINIVRDPRDVLLSQKNKWRRRSLGAKNIPRREALRAWVNYHPYTIARLWVAAVRTAGHFAGEPRFTSVRFEDLLRSPEDSVRALCRFLDLPYEPAMLQVPQIGSSTGADRPDQHGLDSRRIGAWRRGGLSPVELQTCQRVAAAAMREWGYEPQRIAVPAWRMAASRGLWGGKMILALLMNLHRTRNLRETVRRRLTLQ